MGHKRLTDDRYGMPRFRMTLVLQNLDTGTLKNNSNAERCFLLEYKKLHEGKRVLILGWHLLHAIRMELNTQQVLNSRYTHF